MNKLYEEIECLPEELDEEYEYYEISVAHKRAAASSPKLAGVV